MDPLDTFPIEFIDVDRSLTEIASAIKAKNRMAYADFFSAALAICYKAPLCFAGMTWLFA